MQGLSVRPSRYRLSVLSPAVIVALAGLIAALMFFSTILELRSVRRELLQTLDEQGRAMMALLQKSMLNATASFTIIEETLAEKLLSNARFLEELDASGLLTEEKLRRLTEANGIHRANIFDVDGERIMSSSPRGAARRMAAAGLIHPRFQEDENELLLGFHQSRFASGQRFAVAKKRRLGGTLILNIDAEEMLDFRRQVGAGRLIRDIGRSRGVVYALVQDSSRVVLASEGVKEVEPLLDDPFLVRAVAFPDSVWGRHTPYQDGDVYEVVQSLIIDGQPEGVLRIGLSGAHLQSAMDSARRRAILASLLLLIVGAVAGNGLIGAQNYRALQTAYRRIETYTGSILQNMTEAVLAVDRNNRVTLANARAEKFFGFEGGELVGADCAAVNADLCRELQRAMDEENPVINREWLLKTPAGDLTVVMSIGLVRDGKGGIDTAFAVIKDVTEEKLLQQDLKRRDQLSAMGHLASGVAHEIRNPLNAISMIAQRFRSEFTPIDGGDEYRRLTAIVVDESRRINDIIQQFLQFARPAELAPEPVNLSEMVHDLVTLLGPEARSKKVELTAVCAVDGEVRLDRAKMKQALINLVRNGIDACSTGNRVELSCAREGKNLLIRVRDTGAGMDAEQLEKIFNLYYTTKEKGTGLGLPIVQQIVAQHGGAVYVESEKSRGTLFTLQLPKGRI
ncbi:PAS domain-containing protein [candidate division KSB1 bacterium]|nr:PAS domain-containing protein [candidate division KSB1 bacterium]